MRHRVGIRIKQLRKARHLTQEQLAEQVERSVDAISALERGKSLPNFETIERLATVLGVAVREFFDFPEDRGESPKRQALVLRLVEGVRGLNDGDLEAVVAQVEAFAKARKGL